MKTLKRWLSSCFLRDARGIIFFCKINQKGVNLIFSLKETFRGGDFHTEKQHNLVVFGRILVRFKDSSEEKMTLMSSGKRISILPNIPHLFKSETRSLVLEWYDKPPITSYYAPYRKFIVL